MTTIRSQWRNKDPDIYYLFNKFSIVTEIFWVIGLTLLLNKLILHFTLICENKQLSISPFLGNKLSNLTILHKKYTYSWVEYHLRMLGVIKKGLKRCERVWHGKGLLSEIGGGPRKAKIEWYDFLTLPSFLRREAKNFCWFMYTFLFLFVPFDFPFLPLPLFLPILDTITPKLHYNNLTVLNRDVQKIPVSCL